MPQLRILKGDQSIQAEAAQLRKDIIVALYKCGGGHYGGSLSVLDIILTLYRTTLRVSPQDPLHPLRDRFILSKGHAAIAWYAVLRKLGFVEDPLEEYGQLNSPYEGHPDMTRIDGIDFSTGSLGQGLSVGVGMALALRNTDSKIWVVLGDGECQEGQVWEAMMLAARYHLDNLVAIVDYNKHQEWGWSFDNPLDNDPIPQMKEKWSAFGWHVLEVDGHNPDKLTDIFQSASMIKDQPVVVIAHTIKGKGYSLIEADPKRFHCTGITEQEHMQLIK